MPTWLVIDRKIRDEGPLWTEGEENIRIASSVVKWLVCHHLLIPNNISKLSTLFPLFWSITEGDKGFLLSTAKFSRKGRPWTSWKTVHYKYKENCYIVRLKYHKNKICKTSNEKKLFIHTTPFIALKATSTSSAVLKETNPYPRDFPLFLS